VSSYFAALILGVPLGSWLGDRLGWNAVFGTAAVMALALLVSIHFLLPPLGVYDSRITDLALAEHVRRYVKFLKKQSLVGALLSSFFASAGTTGFIAFLGIWLHDSFGIAVSQIGLVFLASGAAALLASPFAGSISDKIGKRIQFVVSNVALAAFLLILPMLHWGPVLFGVFGMISLSAAFRQGPMEAVLTEIVSSASRGSFVALKNSFSQLGIALSAMLSGILFERGGYAAVCFLSVAANLLATGGMLLTVKEHRL